MKFQGKEWGAGNGVDLNFYDFGARRYDPSIGRWLSQDPLAEKYYGHTPYLFCAANPISNIDPYGKDVHPKGDRELEIIRNTLPEEARPYVQINKQGLIDYDLLKQYTGASNNYLSLLEMVNNTQTVSVTLSDSFIYSDRQGVLRKGELSYQEGYPELMDSNIEIVSGLTTGEGGNYGKTLFPDELASRILQQMI